MQTNIIAKGTGTGNAYKYLSLTPHLRDLMPPKIPQLKRENASLRQAKIDTQPAVQEAGTNQKIPQTHPTIISAKVWWDDQKARLKFDCKEEERHNAVLDK